MDTDENIINILKKVDKDSRSTQDLRENSENILNLLKNLERSGLICREDASKRITACRWRITPEGRSFIKLKNYPKKKNYDIVMTLPPPFKKGLMEKHPSLKLTDDAIRKMFLEATEKVRILSPYVDASVIDYIQLIKENVKIEFLTTLTAFGKNMILERLKQHRKNLEVKYIIEKEGNIQKFQTHAKIVIVDQLKIYIGSANFKDTSMLYNLEGGIILSEPEIIREYISIFDDIYCLIKN
jgi:hypothetical protein